MPHKRYRAPPDVLRLLQRDGIGWGHDLTAGCFDVDAAPKRRKFWKKGEKR